MKGDPSAGARIIEELRASRELDRNETRTVRVGMENWTLYGPDDAMATILRHLPLVSEGELPLVASAIVEEQRRRLEF